jgi:hypothetical protein
VQKQYQTRDDGHIIGSQFEIQVKGKLVAEKGSPTSSGTFWTNSGYPPDEVLTADTAMKALIRKQEALRKLFAIEGQSFEVQPWDGSEPMKCNPRVRSIEFPDGQWFNVCDYIITLEADVLYEFGATVEDSEDVLNYKVSRAANEWNIEAADEIGRTWRLTHSVSAQGKRFYDDAGSLTQEAWQNAQDYVLNRIGLGLDPDRMAASGILNYPTLQAFNYLRSNQVNEGAGTFAVTETWLCFDPQGQPPAIDESTVTARRQEDGKTRVTVEGTIRGLEQRDNNTGAIEVLRYANALAKWQGFVSPNLYGRAQTVANLVLNPTPLANSFAFNDVQGTINYSIDYDNRIVPVTPGAITEVVTQSDRHATDVFASIPVLGRALGPVLQSIQTVTDKRRTISIEIQMPAQTLQGTPGRPNTNLMVLSLYPPGIQVFLDQDEESWTPSTGKYARTTSFTWE